MHNEAYAFVRQFATDEPISVIEIGSRNINGSVRMLFPNATWTGIDLYDGPGVDVVGSALDYVPPDTVDAVICCEVCEHAAEWRELIAHARWWLKPGGKFIITCAGPGREPHSHIDGCQLRDDEFYENVSVDELRDALIDSGLTVVICTQLGNDTQALAMLLS